MKTTIPALIPSSIRVPVNYAETRVIEHRAAASGLTVQNYVRQELGLPVRLPGRPTLDQIEEMVDEARDLLQSIGVDPRPYAPEPVPQAPSDDEMTPEQRAERIAKIRAIAGTQSEDVEKRSASDATTRATAGLQSM